MKTTKFRREFCTIHPLRVFARVLLALCVALTFAACENWMVSESPRLIVSAPIFVDAQTGYASVTTKISIRNTGKKMGYIKSISVSPATAFAIIDGGSGTVGAGNNILRTVQLKSGLAVGTYDAVITVSYKGIDASTETAKAPVSFTVTSAPAPEEATRVLDVAAPSFDVVTIGAPRSVPQIIDIKNIGNSPATISNVTVSDTAKFTIGGSGSTVNGNSSIASWTVQPKSTLGIGTHTATITVTYNGTSGTTATAEVTFTVMPFERFIAVSDSSDQVAYSADGSSWKTAPMATYENWQSITYGGDKFVAVARTGTSGTNIAAYSFDGINWIPTTMPTTAFWNSITYGNGTFVATAYNSNNAGAAYSSDGVTWTLVSTSAVSTRQTWASVTYSNGKFAIMAANWGVIRSSTDGISWIDGSWPSVVAGGSGGSWLSAIYAFDKYVAVNNENKTAYVPNPKTAQWIAVALPGAWNAITYGNNTLVAVASGSNQIATSADGISWTTGTLPESGNWNSLTYTGGKFFAVANDKVAYSTTGVIGSWTVAAMPAGAWRSVAYGVAPH
ncbi:MAG: hypothetical protein Ta2A_15520 [Treponemataceae bacterium]|nr:MAG: hypothetical protein Ta2A_15520 [Treponemataceae bacterium]